MSSRIPQLGVPMPPSTLIHGMKHTVPILLAVGLVSPVWAADSATNQDATGSDGTAAEPVAATLQEAHAQLGEPLVATHIVVTGAPTAAPLTVELDPRQPRQPIPAQDGADFLKTVAGFSVIRKAGTDGDPLFRGMAGSRLNVLADDSPLLGACGNRMDPPTAYIFPQSYDSVRILKGPQTVVWGGGASAATVLFERKDYSTDQAGQQLNARLTSGRWGRRDLAADAQLGTANGYVRLQGSDTRGDDYRDGDGLAVHAGHERWQVQMSAGWLPADNWLVEVSTAQSDGSVAYADRGMDGSRFDRQTYGLRIQVRPDHHLVERLEARFSYNYTDHVMDNYSLRTLSMPSARVSNPDRRTRQGRLLGELQFGEPWSLSLGMDLRDDVHRTRGSLNQEITDYRDVPFKRDGSFLTIGAFGEVHYHATSQQTWIAGARLDRIRVEDHREQISGGTNDTAGAVTRDTLSSAFLRIEQGLMQSVLFAGVGMAERQPDYWERIGGGKRSLDGNSAFFTRPERTTQLDTGLVYTADRLRASVSLFANRIDDFILIDSRPDGLPVGPIAVRNVDAVSVGGELEFGAELTQNWSSDLTLAYTYGRNRTDGSALAQIPPLEGRLSVNYQYGNLSTGALLRAVQGQRRVDPGRGNIAGQDLGTSAGFATLALNAGYRLTDALGLSLGVDNLLDRAYVEHLSRAGGMVAGYTQTAQVPEPGRVLWMTLDLRI